MNPSEMWMYVQLGDVCEIGTGDSAPQDSRYFDNGEIPFIRMQDVGRVGIDIYVTNTKDRVNEQFIKHLRLWPQNSLLIPKSGASTLLNHRALLRQPSCVVSHLAILVSSEVILPEYLYFASLTIDAAKIVTDIGYPSLRTSDIAKVKILLPPLPEQQRIAAILRHVAGLRRQRREADDLAQKLIPALFYRMFGDPAQNPMKWPKVRVGDILTSCEYGSSQKPDESGQGTPIIRMNNVTYEGSLKLDDLKYVTLSDKDHQKYALMPGDVLFNRTNSRELVGKTAMWDGRIDAIPASYFIRLRFDPAEEHPLHFVIFMNLPYMKRRLLDTARGAIGQANINAKELQSLTLPKPPLSLQQEFADLAHQLSALADEQSASRSELEKLSDSLLSRAFTGELTAAWRDQHAAELRTAAEQHDAWLAARGVRSAAASAAVSAPPPTTGNPLLERLSLAQRRVHALALSHPAAFFTPQTLCEAQGEESPLDRDVIERGLAVLEALGAVARVRLPVSPTGEAYYQSAYQRVTPPDLGDELRALKERFPHIRP